jgi:hypothetical protein
MEVVKDGVNALLLPMNDAEVFAVRTEGLWRDEQRRLAMRRAARQTMIEEMRSDEMAKLVRPVYERAREVFLKRNSGVSVASLPHSTDEPRKPGDDVHLSALNQKERRKVRMREALAWGENLVLYQDQRGAALRLIMKAWRDNPTSLEPPRVMLRRFLPQRVTRGIVSLKRRVMA